MIINICKDLFLGIKLDKKKLGLIVSILFVDFMVKGVEYKRNYKLERGCFLKWFGSWFGSRSSFWLTCNKNFF